MLFCFTKVNAFLFLCHLNVLLQHLLHKKSILESHIIQILSLLQLPATEYPHHRMKQDVLLRQWMRLLRRASNADIRVHRHCRDLAREVRPQQSAWGEDSITDLMPHHNEQKKTQTVLRLAERYCTMFIHRLALLCAQQTLPGIAGGVETCSRTRVFIWCRYDDDVRNIPTHDPAHVNEMLHDSIRALETPHPMQTVCTEGACRVRSRRRMYCVHVHRSRKSASPNSTC